MQVNTLYRTVFAGLLFGVLVGRDNGYRKHRIEWDSHIIEQCKAAFPMYKYGNHRHIRNCFSFVLDKWYEMWYNYT